MFGSLGPFGGGCSGHLPHPGIRQQAAKLLSPERQAVGHQDAQEFLSLLSDFGSHDPNGPR